MPVIQIVPQHIQHARLHALFVVAVILQRLRQLIRHRKRNADLIAAQPVRVFLNARHRVLPVHLPHLHGVLRAHAKAAEECHQIADAVHTLHLLGDFFRLFQRDALHGCKPRRVFLNHLNGFIAERFYNSPRQRAADALHRAARKVFQHRRRVRRTGALKRLCAELLPERRVRCPCAIQVQPLPNTHIRERPHYRDELFAAIDLQHRVLVAVVVVDDIFHAAFHFQQPVFLRHRLRLLDLSSKQILWGLFYFTFRASEKFHNT